MKTFVNINVKIPVWLDKICTWPVVEYRRRKYGYPFRRIDLGEGEFTIVDPLDYYRLGHFKWYLSGSKGKFYAVRNIKVDATGTKSVRLHREIMNPPEGILVDHQNSNPLDNRRANLRLATHAQNMHNRQKIQKKTSSRFVGVCFEKQKQRWIVYITNLRKRIYLGRFKSEIDAARAYDRAALKYFGDFARLNFPREDYKDLIEALKQNEKKPDLPMAGNEI